MYLFISKEDTMSIFLYLKNSNTKILRDKKEGYKICPYGEKVKCQQRLNRACFRKVLLQNNNVWVLYIYDLSLSHYKQRGELFSVNAPIMMIPALLR